MRRVRVRQEANKGYSIGGGGEDRLCVILVLYSLLFFRVSVVHGLLLLWGVGCLVLSIAGIPCFHRCIRSLQVFLNCRERRG
jgi:hypothetical protein